MGAFGSTNTYRAFTLHLIPCPDRNTGTQEEEGTCPKSHSTLVSRRFYHDPDLAPPGGPGAPGGEFALTRGTQAKGDPAAGAAVPGALTLDGNNLSAPRGLGQALHSPTDVLGRRREKPGITKAS